MSDQPQAEAAHALIGIAHDAGTWVGACMCGAETGPLSTEQAARDAHAEHTSSPANEGGQSDA